jgi:outer membrane protein OmpA-like peptidoglycan-associated protein
MGVPESTRQSGLVAHAAGLRTILAVTLLALGVADLAAIHGAFLPRYLAGRAHGPRDVPRVLPARVQAPTPPSPSPLPQAEPTHAQAPAPPARQALAAEDPPPAPARVDPEKTTPGAAPAAEESSFSHLLFARNTAWLSPESRETLGKLALHLKENPDMQALLSGHTDDLGAPELNHSLSRGRATHAREWLLERGVAPEQIEIRSFGASRPAAPGQSPEARAKNRRVEITFRERSP